jgi:hypothetical protein
MTVARDLAEFLTGTSSADLPPKAIEYAAMLIASTLASATMGAGLESSTIIRDLSRGRGGTGEASVWFDPDPKLPASDAARVNAVMSDVAAYDSDLRNIRPRRRNARRQCARHRGAVGRQWRGCVDGHRARLRGGPGASAKRSPPASTPAAFMAASSRSLPVRSPPGGWLRLDPMRMAQAIALSATSIGGPMTAANTSIARESHAGLAAILASRQLLMNGRLSSSPRLQA